MSRTPYFFVERPNPNTGKYEMQHPIVWNRSHTKQEPADLFPYNGHHDLFSIVENSNIGNDFPTMRGIHCGLPENVADEIRKVYNDCSSENGHAPTARWFSYADMYIYCLEHPEAIDYEATMEIYYDDDSDKEDSSKKIMMPTPMKALMDRVDAFLNVMDSWDWRDDWSQIRIVYWIE